ncbi:DegT/DnrJ/EryC1/StrS family aminotransferase, partial [Candidatus Saccharibacteria bacterium]|nr:DegT/DnrJ/EryC1/StrS family aminotransferase [Candidatus Saccharibacteria bacterium]
MGKHYFLSLASQFRLRDVLRHTFSFGTQKDSEVLISHLAKRYNTSTEKVALYATGRSALARAIELLVPPDSEVIITSLTCHAVVESVVAAGCTPVFADVNKETLHYGVKELRACYKEHHDAKAIIVQNNLGYPVDMKSIEKFCDLHDLIIIEDLAHCAGVYYPDGREAGTVGDAAILSFGKGKSIDTIAGGALILNNADEDHIIDAPSRRPSLLSSIRARLYPLFGWLARLLSYLHLSGIFMRILLFLRLIQRSADAELDLTRRCTHWQSKLALRQLKRLPKNRPPIRDFFFVKDRELVLKKLQRKGFYFNDVWYDVPVAPVRYFADVNFPSDECPIATELAAHIINIPTHSTKI